MIGIFGGTFDPVHLGHIQPALDVKQALSLDELRFIPCSIPAHRDIPIATVEQRVDMLQAAIDGLDGCIVDERELNRQGISYMVDTLKSLHQDFNDQRLCLIVGMDAFMGLNKWHQWQDIFKLANCVVTHRPGFDLDLNLLDSDLVDLVSLRQVDSKIEFLDNGRKDKTMGKLLFMPVTQLDISATDIRQRIKKQQPIENMVSAKVNKFIQQQQLYIG